MKWELNQQILQQIRYCDDTTFASLLALQDGQNWDKKEILVKDKQGAVYRLYVSSDDADKKPIKLYKKVSKCAASKFEDGNLLMNKFARLDGMSKFSICIDTSGYNLCLDSSATGIYLAVHEIDLYQYIGRYQLVEAPQYDYIEPTYVSDIHASFVDGNKKIWLVEHNTFDETKIHYHEVPVHYDWTDIEKTLNEHRLMTKLQSLPIHDTSYTKEFFDKNYVIKTHICDMERTTNRNLFFKPNNCTHIQWIQKQYIHNVYIQQKEN